MWRHQAELLKQLPEQARDGTITEVLQLPVLLWRVKTDASGLLRNRREIAGSGDYAGSNDNEDDYDDDDDYDYNNTYDDGERGDGDINDPITEIPPRPRVPNASASKGVEEEPEHPHRHHHGEETIDSKVRVRRLIKILSRRLSRKISRKPLPFTVNLIFL